MSPSHAAGPAGDFDAVEPRVVEPQDPAIVALGRTIVMEPVAQGVQVLGGGDLDPDQAQSERGSSFARGTALSGVHGHVMVVPASTDKQRR